MKRKRWYLALGCIFLVLAIFKTIDLAGGQFDGWFDYVALLAYWAAGLSILADWRSARSRQSD